MSLIPRLFNYHMLEALRPRRFWLHDPFAYTMAEMNAMMDRLAADHDVGFELEKKAFGKNGFQVNIDVKQFKPSEITVKTIDNTVVVEGKHEDRQDGVGFISRHFVRKYTLPTGYDPKKVMSSLSSDGVLTVKAAAPQNALDSNERIVEIHQTGPADLNVKDNPPVDDKTDKK